jgi:hypothetical protein
VVLASRWWAGGVKSGRLDKPADQLAASYLLEALIRGAGALGVWRLKLQIHEDWLPRWPRPNDMLPALDLTVCAAGFIDLAPLDALSPQADGQVARTWVEFLACQCDGTKKLSLKRLLQSTIDVKAMQSVYRQSCWLLGERVELAIYSGREKGKCSLDLSVPLKSTAVELTSMDPSVQDAYLCKYIYSSVEASRNRTSFTMACDKANVGGLSLFNSILVYPDGLAVICPPVARPLVVQLFGP